MKFISFLLAFIFISCTTYAPVRDLDYKKYNLYSADNSGNFRYADLGPIYSKQSTWVFGSCKDQAKIVMIDLVGEAKSKGGNAVVNVRWRRDDTETAMPTCKKKYGFVWLAVVGLLLPWVKTVEANGTAAKIDDTMQTPATPNTDVLFIPENKSINTIVDEYIALMGLE
jgi:hypothetical protein